MSQTVCAVEQEACFSAQHHGFARFDQRETPQYLLDQYQQYNTVHGMCRFVARLWQHLTSAIFISILHTAAPDHVTCCSAAG